MRSIERTLQRDAAAIAAAMIAVGASFGAIAISYGLPTWSPFLLSTVVFAGGAQFLAVGLIAAGNPLAAVFAGLLLNARHLPFGLAIGGTVGSRLSTRLIGSHLMTDEVVAFTLAEPDPARRRKVYWLIGITLFTSWNIGSALGVLLGGAVGNTDALGLDAAFPAGLIALIMPSLSDRRTRVAALSGAAAAVLLTPVLPAGLPVLCALTGLLTLIRPAKAKPTDQAIGAESAGQASRADSLGQLVSTDAVGAEAASTDAVGAEAASTHAASTEVVGAGPVSTEAASGQAFRAESVVQAASAGSASGQAGAEVVGAEAAAAEVVEAEAAGQGPDMARPAGDAETAARAETVGRTAESC